MSQLPLSSVLIGTKDRPNVLIRCLKSVLAQTYQNMEILILDDNSKESICRRIEGEFADGRIKCFRSDITLGVAGGRNVLIKEAKGDFLVTLDDDAIFRDKDSVSKVIGLFDSSPDVGLFAFKIIDILDGKQVGFKIPFPRATWHSQEIINRSQYVSYFVGAGHAIRRDVFEKCGLYQSKFIYGCEEEELSYRLIESGYKIYYTHEVVVHHYPDYAPAERSVRKEYNYYRIRNRIWTYYKHLPWFLFLVKTSIWCVLSIGLSLRTGGFSQTLRGIKEGFRDMRKLKRTPVSKSAINYMKQNNGRLYF